MTKLTAPPSIVLDLLHIMDYDYHGGWEEFTGWHLLQINTFILTVKLWYIKYMWSLCVFLVAGHNSPLFGRREEDEVEHPGHNFNVNDTIAWWLSQVYMCLWRENLMIIFRREPQLRSWLLVCQHLAMAGSWWMKMRCQFNFFFRKYVISSERSLLPDSSQ